MSGSWKERERMVAGWFKTWRNPLSGRNNRNDDGSKRLGDIIYPFAVVEVKRRKGNAAISRAKETRDLASAKGLPFLHLEFSTGQPNLVALVTDFDTAQRMIGPLRGWWERNPGMLSAPQPSGEGTAQLSPKPLND